MYEHERYGAKLANIFSTRFTIETADRASGKKYRQTFRDNMTVRLGDQIYVYMCVQDIISIVYNIMYMYGCILLYMWVGGWIGPARPSATT